MILSFRKLEIFFKKRIFSQKYRGNKDDFIGNLSYENVSSTTIASALIARYIGARKKFREMALDENELSRTNPIRRLEACPD